MVFEVYSIDFLDMVITRHLPRSSKFRCFRVVVFTLFSKSYVRFEGCWSVCFGVISQKVHVFVVFFVVFEDGEVSKKASN